MILISHRGNLDSKNEELENDPTYIDNALNHGYNVEIDLWVNSNVLYLGHDSGKYEVQLDWLTSRVNKLWIHCKNIQAVVYMNSKEEFNYFWHEKDTLTLTSKKYIWAYPGTQPILNSIAVLPEAYYDDTTKCIGICSDEIVNYDWLERNYKK
jgi:hypothetical protein